MCRLFALISFILLLQACSADSSAATKNGFDLTDALIPIDKIFHGGPPRDGIPAIDRPKFITAKKASFLKPQDRVLGISLNGINKAYPIKILNWHEVVNDRYGSDSRSPRVVVSFCPLCGTGMAFRVDGLRAQTFGVSGLLYNSDVLLYDRQTESLWSQLLSKAIAGPLKGTRLTMIALSHTTWADWKKKHPDTLVLSTITGYVRDYNRNPYSDYDSSTDIFFPVDYKAGKYHPKERVIGLEIDGQFKAYPFQELDKHGTAISETFAGKNIRIVFDSASQSGTIFDQQGREIPTVISFWFAWRAFHPDSAIFVTH